MVWAWIDLNIHYVYSVAVKSLNILISKAFEGYKFCFPQTLSSLEVLSGVLLALITLQNILFHVIGFSSLQIKHTAIVFVVLYLFQSPLGSSVLVAYRTFIILIAFLTLFTGYCEQTPYLFYFQWVMSMHIQMSLLWIWLGVYLLVLQQNVLEVLLYVFSQNFGCRKTSTLCFVVLPMYVICVWAALYISQEEINICYHLHNMLDTYIGDPIGSS